MLDRLALGCGVLLGMLLAGCDRPPAKPPAVAAAVSQVGEVGADAGAVAVRMGAATLGAAELGRRLAALPARQRREMTPEQWQRLIENVALEEMIFADGVALGIDRDPAIERQVESLRRRLVVQRRLADVRDQPAPGPDEIRAAYEQDPERHSTARIRVRHLLVKGKEEAARLRQEALANPGKFADLAREHSTDPSSARRGGDLGFFGRGRMVPEFEVVAFAMQNPGEISEVIATPYGFHVLQFVERRAGAVRPFAEVEPQLREMLHDRRRNAANESYMKGLREASPIEIDDAVAQAVIDGLPEPLPPSSH